MQGRGILDIVSSALILYNLLITFHATMNVVCSSAGLKGTVPVMRLIENDLAPSAVDAQFAKEAVTIADIWKAHKLLKPRLHHTHIAPSPTLHDLTGADVYFKAENMQRSGSV